MLRDHPNFVAVEEIHRKMHDCARFVANKAVNGEKITPDEYDRVIGFEDSESGVIAIRAAGVGCCVALPFAQSAGHDLSAAVHVLTGQIPEALLNHNAFLSPQALRQDS